MSFGESLNWALGILVMASIPPTVLIVLICDIANDTPD